MSDPIKVHADLRNILARSEFQVSSGRSTNPLTDAIKRVQHEWEHFRKWFSDLFNFASKFGTLGQSIVYVIVGLLLVGAGWVLARVLREYFQNRAVGTVGERTVFDVDDPEDSISHDSAVWLKDAEGMASSSDYRRAYRAVFVATLMHFETAGIVAFERGKTNGEYFARVRAETAKAVWEPFRTFVIGFDSRWYGSELTTEADYMQALKFYADIQHSLVLASQKVGGTPAMEGA